jgi:uncharacterized membrane protein
LIGSRYDLGSIGTVFGQPKHYARFLGQELTLVYHGRLLVVMPTGYGVARGGTLIASEQGTLDRLPAPGRSGDQLVAAAIEGVRQLAAAAGVVVAVPPPATRGSSTAVWIWVVVGAAIALVLAFAAWFLIRRGR